ncbi:hypothetical protein BAUCODRAFT_549812 [Baudoinia panamericana UAMH 10762]|uniref:CENP-V/GFA domain-containing protein n=1 Tax=Baudoinia panamericana (strain UAMH 10762) TaxID=717646 RepID=M2N638_BAUPA|nr:uncharacterized protein BAUCODRAFT_549812 [Baudoinia panamericana UAMH 10762]EMC94489.1 hypothetical protein BAUCODRAFT_549812 [Baudoinia panamericana UAMH 10762]
MASTLKGSCACGAITWTSSQPAQNLDYCYCKTCQQISGAPFIAWLGIPKATLTWSGQLHTFTVNDLAARSCCGECGSTMTMQYHCFPDRTHVAAGSVTEGGDGLPQVEMHIFTKNKPVWYSIPDDNVPRWEEFDTETDRMLAEFDKAK